MEERQADIVGRLKAVVAIPSIVDVCNGLRRWYDISPDDEVSVFATPNQQRLLIFNRTIIGMLLTNVVSKPLTPPEEYALTRLFIEITGYSEANSKSMVASFSQLSRLSFPPDADILACMMELSDCIISCRHSREEQNRRSTLHSLTRKLADPVPCGSLLQRATLTKQRVAVAYEILQVFVMAQIPPRCCRKTSTTPPKTLAPKKSLTYFLRHCRNLSQR